MTRTYWVSDHDEKAAYLELGALYDTTEIRGFAEAGRRALARVTWRWRAAAEVLYNAARLKSYRETRARWSYAQAAPGLVALRQALADPRERAHFDRIQRGEY